MAVPFSGGCICGAVRYECLAEPVVSGFCHCRDCQRETGSAFGTTLFVPRNAVTIVGEVKYYDGKGDSGNIVSRGFCPTCGARLFGKPALLPELLAIRAGSPRRSELGSTPEAHLCGQRTAVGFHEPGAPEVCRNAANIVL